MRKLLLAGAAVLSIGGIASAQEVRMHGPAKAAAEILVADRAFADRVAAVGASAAFGEALDPTDGTWFRFGDPPMGRAAAIAASLKANGSDRLSASPTAVFASSGGDMGLVLGRLSVTPPGASAPSVVARYQNVWRRDASGRWMVLTGMGQPERAPKP